MLSLSNSSLNTAHLKGVAGKQPYRNSSLVLAEPKTIYADGEQGKKFVTPTPGEETFVHLALQDTTTDLHTVTHPPEILFNLSSSHSSATQSTHF